MVDFAKNNSSKKITFQNIAFINLWLYFFTLKMSQSNNTYSINTYRPIPISMTAPVTEYKATVEGYIAKCGVRWVYNKKITEASNDEDVSSSTTPAVKRRKRQVNYHWYIDYQCHRSGKKRVKAFTNLSGKQRAIQKASKKSNCPARLKVICFKNSPEMVTLETIKEHNHEIGGVDDLQHLPLSKEARECIENRLKEEYRKRETRLSI